MTSHYDTDHADLGAALNHLRTLRNWAIVILLLVWGFVTVLLWMSAKANRILAQEARAESIQAQQDAASLAGALAPYMARDAAARAWKPGDPLPPIPGMEAPKR